MARYRLGTAIVGAPPNGQYQKFRAGTVIVDSIGNSLADTDVVWPSLAATPSASMVPLDAAAAAIMTALYSDIRAYPNACLTVGAPSPAATGMDSVS